MQAEDVTSRLRLKFKQKIEGAIKYEALEKQVLAVHAGESGFFGTPAFPPKKYPSAHERSRRAAPNDVR